MVQVTLSGQEELLGRVIRDMVSMRGEFDTPSIRKGWFTLEAKPPWQRVWIIPSPSAP